MRQKPTTSLIILFIAMLVLTSLACATVTNAIQEPTAVPSDTPVPPPTAIPTEEPTDPPQTEEPTEVIETEAPTEELTEAVTETEEMTEEPTEETEVASGEPLGLEVLDSGFGQDEDFVGYAFLLRNPNTDISLVDVECQISLHNAEDQIVETSSRYVTVLAPGEVVGVGGEAYLDEGVEVASLEIKTTFNDYQTELFASPFTTDMVTFYEDEWFSNVTGIVHNPNSKYLDDLYATAVLYDADDNIIGSGYTYFDFLPPEGSVGVTMSATYNGEVDHVEMYAHLTSSMWWYTDDEPAQGDWSDPAIANSGFGQDESNVGYGFILNNPNSSYAIEDSQYHVTAYAADGSVLGVSSGYIEILLPGESFGIGGNIYLVREEMVDTLEIVLESGDFIESDPLPSFTFENATYIDDDWYPTVTGEIVNPYDFDLSDLEVYAITYNAAGEINGGGYSFADFVLANDSAPVEINVYAEGEVASVELYSTVYYLDDLRP